MSGGAGTQGTYTALDPEGLGIPGSDGVQARSPGLSSKAGRRAAMHITGPTMVTVPLHITSNLALGVLQGGGSDRIVHRGRDKDGGDKLERKERVEKRKERRAMEWNVEEPKKTEETERSPKEKEEEETKEGGDEKKVEGGEEEEDEKQAMVLGDQDVPQQQEPDSFSSNREEDDGEAAADDDQNADNDSEYMGNIICFIFIRNNTSELFVF